MFFFNLLFWAKKKNLFRRTKKEDKREKKKHTYTQMSLTLTHLVKQFRENEELELEMRFCDKRTNTINKNLFTKLLNMMLESMKYKVVEGSKEPVFIIDYFYSDNIRQRCIEKSKTEVIQKTLQSKIIGTCPRREFYHFIYTLKKEHVLTKEEALDKLQGKTPSYVRCHYCWVFTYKNQFAYVFKQVKSGANKVEVCESEEPDFYEIELEVLRDHAFLESNVDNEDIASTLIEKSLDLSGRCKANSSSSEKLTMVFDDTMSSHIGDDNSNFGQQRQQQQQTKEEKQQQDKTNNEQEEEQQIGVTTKTIAKPKRRYVKKEKNPPKEKKTKQRVSSKNKD